MTPRRRVVTFVDVDSPVLNVYADYFEPVPGPGEFLHLGVPDGNSMHGDWAVLSIERPWDAIPDATNIRVNIIRKERLAG